MRPFEISTAIQSIRDIYPEALEILSVVSKSPHAEIEAIVRLWLSEGIPFAFKDLPALYEVIRAWIASRLSVHPKEITLIGSGRQGSSLASPPNTGKPFDKESDLDWSVISEPLFIKCSYEFNNWADDYENNQVHPRNEAEKKYWLGNLALCRSTIKRGFIDSNKIPTWDRYPISQLIGNTMWQVKAKSHLTNRSPLFRKSSLRIYKDWSCFVRQLVRNLENASKRLKVVSP
jgi:hypothetical protein